MSDLFKESFRLATNSLFVGMTQNLQESVLKDKVISFVEIGFCSSEIEEACNSEAALDSVRDQFREACEEELADVVLRLSTEDTFDLLCDIAARHGRQLRRWGPPCACFFCDCHHCLDTLVQRVKDTPSMKLPERPRELETAELVAWIRHCIEVGLLARPWSIQAEEQWLPSVVRGWQRMTDELWRLARTIVPMDLPRVRDAYAFVRSVRGVNLYYAVAIRELTASDSYFLWGQKRGQHDCISLERPFADRLRRDTTAAKVGKTFKSLDLKAICNSMGCFATLDAAKAAMPDSITMTGEGQCSLRDRGRKALASVVREIGNVAYESKEYSVAFNHYSRAIGYDVNEPIFFLNRAACLLKLRKHSLAEADCSIAIALCPENHKAWFRRGVSRAEQGNRKGAREGELSEPKERTEDRLLSTHLVA